MFAFTATTNNSNATIQPYYSFMNGIYFNLFKDKGYDNIKLAAELTREDLDEIGVTIPGHRKMLLLAAAELKQKSMY